MARVLHGFLNGIGNITCALRGAGKRKIFPKTINTIQRRISWSKCDTLNGIQFRKHCCIRTRCHKAPPPPIGTHHWNLDDSLHLVKYLSFDDRNVISFSTAIYNIIKFKIEEFSFTMSRSKSSHRILSHAHMLQWMLCTFPSFCK